VGNFLNKLLLFLKFSESQDPVNLTTKMSSDNMEKAIEVLLKAKSVIVVAGKWWFPKCFNHLTAVNRGWDFCSSRNSCI
jgi:hypothetical protein